MVRDVKITVPSAINSQVSPKLEAIVLKALAAEPDDRYQSSMELHDALQAFMFEEGIFASRKDLAAWMREQYSAEIEEEKRKAQSRSQAGGSGGGGVPKKTMMMSPGMLGGPGGPPPPPGGGRRPPPPKPGGRKSPPPPKPGGGPPSRPSAVPTQAHKVVSANVPKAGPPKPGGRGGGRTRAKTMLMSPKQAPVRAAPPSKPKPKPKPKPKAAPKPKASYEGPTQGSDFDWDDDELETRLFDAPAASSTGGAGRAQSAPAPKKPAKPIGGAAPPAPKSAPPKPAGPPSTPAAAPKPAAAPAAPAAAAPAVVSAEPSYDPGAGKNKGVVIGIIALLSLLLVGGAAFFIMGGDDGESAETAAESGAAENGDAGAVAAANGSLSVTVEPADAEIQIDGKVVAGTGSPRALADISAGSHKVTVSKGADFLPFEKDVAIIAGQALPLDVKLESAKVTLKITREPSSAKVTLLAGDKAVPISGKGTLSHELVRQPGVEYKLRGEAKGYTTSEVPLSFDGKPEQPVSLTLAKVESAAEPTPKPTKKATTTPKKKKKPAAAKTATLKIGVAPGNPPATVYVDGKKQSKKTPVFVKVAPGKHTVKWVWGGKSSTQRVSVGDGESKLLKGKK
jgi:serine/threonine-protein kinase